MRTASDSGPADARLLLAFALECDRDALFTNDEREPSDAQLAHFGALVDERVQGVPVAYLIGEAWFYGRPFEVTREVLIPRPETEHVVEAVLDDLRARGARGLRVVDVGTGSGAIAVTLACELPEISVIATEISAGALAVARRNVRRHAVEERCELLHGDLLVPLLEGGAIDCIVANLPYIPSARIPAAPNPVAYEPIVALDGGPDGLAPYRRLLAQLRTAAAPGASVFLEAAPPTIEALAQLVEDTLPAAHVEIVEDFGGLDRFLAITLP